MAAGGERRLKLVMAPLGFWWAARVAFDSSWPTTLRATQLNSKEGFEVACAVKHADDLNSIIGGTEEDQVIAEAIDGPDAYFRHFRSNELAPLASGRVVLQEFESPSTASRKRKATSELSCFK